MKRTGIILTMIFSLSAKAQEMVIFDTSKINVNTKLIGRYPQYDKMKTYKKLNFIVEDPQTVKKVIASLTLGKEGPNSIQEQDFRITIVQDFKEVKSWIVNPALNSVMDDGHTYEFAVDKLKGLAEKYPFDYRFDKIAFSNTIEYDEYLQKQKSNQAFLFSYAPQFKYEGSFKIQFPRNETFVSPKAISDYLKPLVEQIVSKNEYTITYILDDKNLGDQTQFTMTITGSKKIYAELVVDKLKKKDWKLTKEQGWFFYRVL